MVTVSQESRPTGKNTEFYSETRSAVPDTGQEEHFGFVANVLIIVNDHATNTLELGLTDGAGAFVFADIKAGESVTLPGIGKIEAKVRAKPTQTVDYRVIAY